MPRIISFAWTTPALLAGQKTVTRRDWEPAYARRFHKGDIVLAYDRTPRVGGKQVATIRLTTDPYFERGCDTPHDDWEAEGFAYLESKGITLKGVQPTAIWRGWKATTDGLWVIRFEVVLAACAQPQIADERPCSGCQGLSGREAAG